MSRSEEGRWLEGLDERTERDRKDERMTADELRQASGEKSAHTVTIKYDGYGAFADLTFHCNADGSPDPDCWMVCPLDECEEGCTDAANHVKKNMGECNVVAWLNGSDDIGCDVIDNHSEVTVPIRYAWQGDYCGWAFLGTTP